MTIVCNLCRICDLTIKAETRVSAGFRFFAGFEVALIVATWPLWWGHSGFPPVPLLPIFLGSWLSKVFTGLLVLSACVIAVTSDSRTALMRYAAMAAIIASLALVVLNQHRLQAWHWLFLLNMNWMLLLVAKDRLTVMQHTICTIYVCSALSRISAYPLSGMTGAIVSQSLKMLGVAGLTQGSRLPFVVSQTLTLGELLIGLLLLNRRTRQVGCIGAIFLHLSLLILLGPPGLDHHAGVLLWNLCFLCVVPTMFWGNDHPTVDPPREVPSLPGRVRRWPTGRMRGNSRVLTRPDPSQRSPGRACSAATRIWIAVVWLYPLSGLVGLADNWPSWQLYSTRPESWILSIHCDDRSSLPQPIAEMLGEPAPFSEWCPLKLDRWSLGETGSPIYPEDRFQLAICASVLTQVRHDVRFQIEVSEPAAPFWWNRHQRAITSRDELQKEHRRFVLNGTVAH